PDESRGAVGIEKVRMRNQRNQLANDRIGRWLALLVAHHESVHVHALSLPDAFVRTEEERSATPDRTAQRAAKLVARERMGLGRRALAEGPRLERGVSPALADTPA